ncbi:MAG: hypothetical protein ABIL76_01675 [candidate division WOR-3 bacterium]
MKKLKKFIESLGFEVENLLVSQVNFEGKKSRIISLYIKVSDLKNFYNNMPKIYKQIYDHFDNEFEVILIPSKKGG